MQRSYRNSSTLNDFAPSPGGSSASERSKPAVGRLLGLGRVAVDVVLIVHVAVVVGVRIVGDPARGNIQVATPLSIAAGIDDQAAPPRAVAGGGHVVVFKQHVLVESSSGDIKRL